MGAHPLRNSGDWLESLERRSLLSVSFAPGVHYSVGNEPLSVAFGDLNSDGKPDMVVANYRDSTISVFLNQGNGKFGKPTTIKVGRFPSWVSIADLGNGKPDIITADAGDEDVDVLIGNGDGTFQPPQSYGTGQGPSQIVVADVNGDNKPDLVVLDYGGAGVSVLLGNGDGTFQNAQNYSVGYEPNGIAVADVTGDSKPDIVVASYGTSAIDILPGNGNGTFQQQTTIPISGKPADLAIGDLTGNGKQDIVFTISSANEVGVLLGNGNGTFQAEQDFPTGPFPETVAIADFNGDGKPDLVVADENEQAIGILLGNGDGTFAKQVPFPAGASPTGIAIADINGDGKLDIAVTNDDFTNSGIGSLGGVHVLINKSPSPTTGSPSLAPSIAKTTLPSAVVAGGTSHGSVTVDVSNTGTATETGAFTTKVFASADGQIDSASFLLGTTTSRAPIRAGSKAAISVLIKSIPATMVGQYTLFAQETSAANIITASAAGPALTAAAPFISLVPTLTDVTAAGLVKYSIMNQGNITPTAKSTVTLLASPTASESGAASVFSQGIVLPLLPGKSKLFVMHLTKAELAVTAGALSFYLKVTDPTGNTQTSTLG